MSWTNDVILEFIDLYGRERILWDPKHPQHKIRGEVSMAWLRIQSCLNIDCSIEELKKKKESLMTSFRFHWNRKKKNPSYRISWFAFKRMEAFLCLKYECDSTNELESEFFSNTDTPVDKDPISCRNPSTPEKGITNIRQTRLKSVISKKCYRNQSDESTTYSKDLNDYNHNHDEYDLYGQLLAKKLRKLEEHQRDMAMHEIDNIMFRAKMQGSSTHTKSYSSPTATSPVPRKMKSPIFIVTQQSQTQYEDENIPYPEHMQLQVTD